MEILAYFSASLWPTQRRGLSRHVNFPQFRGNPSTKTYDLHECSVGLPQEWRMENQVRMKALYAASVNGRGQGTEW